MERLLGLFEVPRVGMSFRANLGSGMDTYRVVKALQSGDDVTFRCQSSCGLEVVVSYARLARAVTRAARWWQITSAAQMCQVSADPPAEPTSQGLTAVRMLMLLGIDPRDTRVETRAEEIDREVAIFAHQLDSTL